MKSFRALIIDDESKASTLLNSLIEFYCPSISEVFVENDSRKGVALIAELEPDILFLDINMPNLNGFDVLNELGDFKGKIIFTTAYEEYAIKAFKYNAFDYLLKPIHVDALVETIERLEEFSADTVSGDLKMLFQQLSSQKNYAESIAIHDKGGLLFIKIRDIAYLESESNYTAVHCLDRKYVSSKTMKNFEDLIDPDTFLRVHRSYIVNVSHIVRFSIENGGELEMANGHIVPVARRKRHILERFSV